MTSSARDEAERLIAAALGAASTALRGADLRRQLGDLASAFAQPTGPVRDSAGASDQAGGPDQAGFDRGHRTRLGRPPSPPARRRAACARSAG